MSLALIESPVVDGFLPTVRSLTAGDVVTRVGNMRLAFPVEVSDVRVSSYPDAEVEVELEGKMCALVGWGDSVDLVPPF